MSSILRTIDALKEIRKGNYVEFHNGRLGYVEELIPPNLVRIIEDNGTTKSTRKRIFTSEQHKVAVATKVGNSYTNN